MASSRESKFRPKPSPSKARSRHAKRSTTVNSFPVAGKWLAWDREQKRIVACGPTRSEARAAAEEAGEAEPVLENAERTRKRFADLYAGGEELRQELLKEEGAPLTEPDVSALLGISPGEVEERREAGSLVGVPVEGGAFLYPPWQFTAHGTLPGLPEVLADLRVHNRHPLAQVRFFLSRNLRLEEQTPLHELRQGKVEEVRQAARTYGEHGAA